jgi:hypothetical protein
MQIVLVERRYALKAPKVEQTHFFGVHCDGSIQTQVFENAIDMNSGEARVSQLRLGQRPRERPPIGHPDALIAAVELAQQMRDPAVCVPPAEGNKC